VCAKQTPVQSKPDYVRLYVAEGKLKSYGLGGKSVALASRKFSGFVVIDSASLSSVERITFV
jgi:hypothetical protein